MNSCFFHWKNITLNRIELHGLTVFKLTHWDDSLHIISKIDCTQCRSGENVKKGSVFHSFIRRTQMIKLKCLIQVKVSRYSRNKKNPTCDAIEINLKQYHKQNSSVVIKMARRITLIRFLSVNLSVFKSIRYKAVWIRIPVDICQWFRARQKNGSQLHTS